MCKPNSTTPRTSIVPATAETVQYSVKLRSVGNPDFAQYAPVSNPETVLCDTLEQVTEECSRYIGFWNLGSGNWPKTIVYQGKRKVCEVSYNGRLWEVGEVGKKAIALAAPAPVVPVEDDGPVIEGFINDAPVAASAPIGQSEGRRAVRTIPQYLQYLKEARIEANTKGRRIAHAEDLLRNAIAELRDAGCDRAADSVARALKSVEGAQRHQDRLQGTAGIIPRRNQNPK